MAHAHALYTSGIRFKASFVIYYLCSPSLYGPSSTRGVVISALPLYVYGPSSVQPLPLYMYGPTTVWPLPIYVYGPCSTRGVRPLLYSRSEAPALLQECVLLSPSPCPARSTTLKLPSPSLCVTHFARVVSHHKDRGRPYQWHARMCRVIRIEGGHTSGMPSVVVYHHPRLVLCVFARKSASGRHYTTMTMLTSKAVKQ